MKKRKIALPLLVSVSTLFALMNIKALDVDAKYEPTLKETYSYEDETKVVRSIKNAKTMANEFKRLGYTLVGGDTENHLVIVNVKKSLGITGRDAEIVLDKVGITVNKNTVPYDTEKPFIASGIRIGTPAITSRGFKEENIKEVVRLIDLAFKNINNEKELKRIHKEEKELARKFPIR